MTRRLALLLLLFVLGLLPYAVSFFQHHVQTVSPDRLVRAIVSGHGAEQMESRRDHYVVAVRR